MRVRTIAAGCIAVGLLFAGCSGSETDASPADPAPVEGPSAGGQDLAGAGRPLDDVVDFWRARAEASSGGVLDRTQLGIALAGQARATGDVALYEESEEVLRAALDVEPEYDVALLALAHSLHAQHEFAEALRLATAVVASDPAALDAIALAGDASLDLGDLDGARRHYRAAAAVDRSAPLVSRLARLAWVEGEADRAVELAEEALALSDAVALRPHDRAFYRFLVGHFRFEVGDVDGAIEALEAALAEDPLHPGARERLAFVYDAAGRRGAAAELYRSLLETGPAADLHAAYADLLARQGADEEAAEQERIAAELAASDDQVAAERRHLAGYLTTRDSDAAVALAEADLAERQDLGAYDTLAWALHHAGDHDGADRAMADALAFGTRSADLFFRAGVIAHAVGDDDRASAHLTAALTVNERFHPTDAEAAVELLAELSSSLVAGR